MSPKIKERLYILTIILLLATCGQFYYTYRYQPAHQIEVFYNKDHKLNRKLIELTQKADKFVYFAIYTFTREDIKNALLAAKYRGLDVRGVTDRNQVKEIEAQKKIVKELRDFGIEVLEHDHNAIMHTKILVTDKGYANGSYNWTTAATDSNDEVLEVGRDENIRQKYEQIVKELLEKYTHTNGI